MTKARIVKAATTLSVPNDCARLLAVTKDGYFRYKIKYNVDPIKAAHDRTFTVLIQIARGPYVREQERTFVNFNATEAIRSLRLRQAKQKDLLKSQKNRYIHTFISDFTKRIPNDKASTLSRTSFNERNVFSKKLKVKPALVSDLQKQNLSLPVLDINRNRLEESDVTFSSNAFKLAAKNLITTNRTDPAQVVGARSNSLVTAVRTVGGVVPKRIPKIQSQTQASKMLTGTLINTRTVTNQFQVANTVYANVLTREEAESIEVEETYNIPIGELDLDEFYLIFQLKDFKGLTKQVISRKVSHSLNIAQLEIPVEPPEVTALPVGQIGRTALDIRQKDANASAVNIYRRELNKALPIFDATYDFVGQANITVNDGIKRVEDIFASTNPIIYRVVPVNDSGLLGADFGSVVVKQQRGAAAKKTPFLQRPKFISIAHEFRERSIVLTLRDFPPEPIALRLLRKDLTIKEQEYTQIGNITLIRDDTNIPITFEDTDVKSDRIYDYSVELIYKDGNVVFASNNLVVEYNPVSSNILQLTVTEPEIVQNGDQFDAVFNIQKDVIQTEGDLIKSFLQEQGILGEFQEQVIENRDTLQQLFAVRVTRTNIITGEIEDFGIVPPGEFSDQRFGRVKSVKPLTPGFDYRYNITAHARNPETLFSTLEKTVNLRTNVSYSYSPFDFRHPVTLTRGNIVTEQSLKRNHSKTTFTFGQIVDTATVDVSLADVLPSLYDGKANLFGEDGVLVQWKIQGNVNKIDHFIVILESLGIRTIVGKSHNITNTNSFQFVDKLTNKECGELTYYIVPVFFDYSRGPELKTNQVLV